MKLITILYFILENLFAFIFISYMFIDSHAHIDLILENNKINEDEIIDGLKDNNITYIVQISSDVNSYQWSYNFSKKHRKNGILLAPGIHPSSDAGEKNLFILSEFIKGIMESGDAELLFGVGECGLDYYRMHQEKEMQIYSFENQIDIAKRWRLPLIVHTRDAMNDTINILKNNTPDKGIMHCFTGDSKNASEILDLGFSISFAGNVTYKNAFKIHESAAYVPLDRLLIETDSPFLTPVPLRGKKNRPEYIIHTYKFVSELRKEPLDKIEKAVYENFIALKKR